MEKKFKVGDRVKTSSEGVWQDTQKSLNNRVGTIVNTNDYPYNIHVKVVSFKSKPVIGFSEFELTKIKQYKRN